MKKLFSTGLFFVMIFLLSGCSSAGGYYRSGKRCFVSGNYEQAAMNFSTAIAKNPNRADYYIDYGMSLTALGHPEEAIAQFDRAYMDKNIVMVKSNNKRALRGKGIAYYYLQDYKEAIRQFDLALGIHELSELDMDILYYKGSSLMAIGAYNEAKDTYTEIIDTFGNEAEALSNRAFTYRMAKDYESSLKDYDMAISLKPGCYEYYFGKYDLMLEMKDDAGAIALLKTASEIEARSKEDQFNQAKVHFYQGLYEQAFSEFSEGFANGFTEAYFYIGEIKNREKDYNTAKYYYEKYIDSGEAVTPAAYNQVAYCLMRMGEYEQAIPYLEKGITFVHAGMQRILKKNEIVAYENLGRFDIARNKLTDYMESYPEDTQAGREEIFLSSRLIEEERGAAEPME